MGKQVDEKAMASKKREYGEERPGQKLKILSCEGWPGDLGYASE